MAVMIEQPEVYFRKLLPARDALLRELEAEAEREKIPIVGPVVGQLLQLLAAAVRAERILELGTATGYSTLFLARALASPNGRVVTVEGDPQMARRAEANFRRAGLEPNVTLTVGDARRVLPGLSGPFDLIFLDIEKADYAAVLDDCTRLTKPGALLIADNVAFADARPFNRAVSQSDRWRAIHLYALLPRHSPEKDGLCLALRCRAADALTGA